jgi:parallel beta-helix repeat protein
MAVFDVRAYGAIANDSIDDTAAIQRALNAAHRAGGGTVNLGSGTYLVHKVGDASEGCVHIESGVTLSGVGMGKSILKLIDGSSGKITGILRTPADVATHDVSIKNLTIDGNRVHTSGDVDGFFCGVTPGSAQQTKNLSLESVEIKNVSRYGFDPHEQTNHLTLKDCYAHDNTGDGFTLDYVSDTTVINCVSTHNGRYGFNLVTSSHDVTFVNCTATWNAEDGLAIQKGSDDRPFIYNVLINAGVFSHNGDSGVLIKLSRDVTVKGALIEFNGEAGIEIQGAQHNTLTANTIRNNSDGDNDEYSGIRIHEYDDRGGTQGTYKLWASTDNLVTQNVISSDAAHALRYGIEEDLDSSVRNALSGNKVSGDVRAPWFLGHSAPVDLIQGTTSSNTLVGTSRSERIFANNGNDKVTGGAGNDTIDAGHGTDSVYYSGSIGNYTVTRLGSDSLQIADHRVGKDGTDRVDHAEYFYFAGTKYSASSFKAVVASSAAEATSEDYSSSVLVQSPQEPDLHAAGDDPSWEGDSLAFLTQLLQDLRAGLTHDLIA